MICARGKTRAAAAISATARRRRPDFKTRSTNPAREKVEGVEGRGGAEILSNYMFRSIESAGVIYAVSFGK